jgi:hypothetical protein
MKSLNKIIFWILLLVNSTFISSCKEDEEIIPLVFKCTIDGEEWFFEEDYDKITEGKGLAAGTLQDNFLLKVVNSKKVIQQFYFLIPIPVILNKKYTITPHFSEGKNVELAINDNLGFLSCTYSNTSFVITEYDKERCIISAKFQFDFTFETEPSVLKTIQVRNGNLRLDFPDDYITFP